MPNVVVDPFRKDLYKLFKYKVKFAGAAIYAAGFSKISSLLLNAELTDHRDVPKSQHGHYSPSHIIHEAISLEKGVTHDPTFQNWAGKGSSGQGAASAVLRRNLVIDVFDETGKRVVSYKIWSAWVSQYSAVPDLDAGSNAVAIESIKLENAGWERDTP